MTSATGCAQTTPWKPKNAMFKARVDDLEKENADLKAANKHTKEDK